MKEKKEETSFEKFLNKKISRRDFIKYSLIGLGGLAVGTYGYKYLIKEKASSEIFQGQAPAELWKWSKEGYHYKQLGENVQCNVCPNNCLLEPEDRSICRNKVNKDGNVVFNTDLVKMKVDVKNAEKIFEDALRVLKGKMPKPSEECEFCEWKDK